MGLENAVRNDLQIEFFLLLKSDFVSRLYSKGKCLNKKKGKHWNWKDGNIARELIVLAKVRSSVPDNHMENHCCN